MCIGVYLKPNAVISDEIIKNCFESNPDGAGLMWKNNKKDDVHILKGFMDVESFLQAFHKIPIKCERGLHFRIATSGKISAECCHPFPVIKKTNEMTKRFYDVEMGMLHNGIISECEPATGMKGMVSDTMVFASKYLNALRNKLDDPEIKRFLEDILGTSKVLVLRKGKHPLMLGKWIEDNGVYYTNDSYNEKSWLYSWRHMSADEQDAYLKSCYTYDSGYTSTSNTSGNTGVDNKPGGYYTDEPDVKAYIWDASEIFGCNNELSSDDLVSAIDDYLEEWGCYLAHIELYDKPDIYYLEIEDPFDCLTELLGIPLEPITF